MNTLLIESPTETVHTRVLRYATELIELVRARHPEARFYGPTYWPDESLWVVDAFFKQGEDFELQEQLSERETDILLKEGIWLCLVPSSFAANPL
ncbi:MAG: hypothetical protein KJZ86_05945 [Caldilineaceae bacterium]|nr:hypothetical protein [Caldilineaceae bacterium]HRJ40335.1 hypothetical protein [Caldilineaceae bacterium]